MKILSWNVNGIRAAIKKGFLGWLKKEQPDVLCLQEIKIAEAARIKEGMEFPGYDEYWNSAERPGYSGTMTLVKADTDLHYFPRYEWDVEGRVQVLDMGKFFLVNVYFPNANHELSRLEFKIKFNERLLKHLKKLEDPSTDSTSSLQASSGQGKPVVVCGDYNVAHNEIDLARPKENVGNPGFTDEERAWMNKLLKKGFTDTFRYFNPKKIQYSWWSYRMGVRAQNVGWRIDYFCVSEKFVKNIKGSYILDKVMGSDHAPVGIELK